MQISALWHTASFSRTTWWLRGPWGCLILRMPGNEPLFSERYGYWKHWRLMGFRIGFRD